MDSIIKEMAANVVTMLVGCIGTGLAWLTKAIYQAKKDLDEAHSKIRSLANRIDELEEELYMER